jgi:hypothetical protein
MCSNGRMAMQSSANANSRRGSCSIEVMQGLRKKCSKARSQPNQMRVDPDTSAAFSGTHLLTSSIPEASELPPDILHSRMYTIWSNEIGLFNINSVLPNRPILPYCRL